MIGAVREWLLGVLCAAVLAALADRLSPQGTAGKIGRMAGGLLLLIAVVRPVVQADLSVLASASLPVWEEIGEAAWAETDMGLLKNIIGEETGAYILDKAEELGIPCTRVEVTCEEKDGVPLSLLGPDLRPHRGGAAPGAVPDDRGGSGHTGGPADL